MIGPMTRGPQIPEIVVDVAAIRANARLLREVTGVPLIAVVKADGYGHGMLESARAALEGGASMLATATLDEALQLRRSGVEAPLMCWLTAPDADHLAALAERVEPTAYSVAELDAIDDAVVRGRAEGLDGLGGSLPPGIQLKVDTGLSRGGAARAEWDALFARARRGETEGRWRVTGVWSHFACADEPAHPANERQETAFREALALAERHGLRPTLRHLANSAAALLRPSSRFDAVRCGIALYGLDPAPGQVDLAAVPLRPAMTVRAPLVMVKHLAAGDAVSYGQRWVAERPTTVGLVPVGYAEGVPRAASRPGERAVDVLVAGRRRPVRGTVCMDQVVVDLDGDEPPLGTEAVLFGDGADGAPTAQEWAEVCGTINYEIVTRIGGRMIRRHVDSDGDGVAPPEEQRR